MTKEQAAKLVALSAANFPTVQKNDLRPTAVLWSNLLSDIPYEKAEQAVIRVIMTAKYFPTVAEIREAVGQLEPTGLISAEEAWLEVMKQLDPYKRPKWSSKEITKTVEAIGYINMCMSENIAIERAQFIKSYNSYKQREENNKINGQLLQFCGMITKSLPK